MPAKENPLSLMLLGIPKEKYGSAQYYEHILEIYKLYVEMADRVSSRRQAANSFFLTINSAIMTLMGYVSATRSVDMKSIFFYEFVAVAGIALCFLWYRVVLSYKQVNAGKFKVIHEIENLLPVRPYKSEWMVLGQGNSPSLYKPLTKIENLVPWVFFLFYIGIIIVVVSIHVQDLLS